MAAATKNSSAPSSEFRRELRENSGGTAARCFQCATCSAVCQLAPPGAPFPRRQMLWAHWGMEERILRDPAIWLCHQCNDCTERCPRDARPGDVMQTLRAMAVERLATPRVVGRLVADAGNTWPLLIGIPILFWIVVLYAVNGLTIPSPPLVYHTVVPHWLIYAVYFPLTALVAIATYRSGRRFWDSLDGPRQGSFWAALWAVSWEIATHRRFGSCGPGQPRRWGHLALVWGFVGAAVTSALIIVALYVLKTPLPLELGHPFKVLGNVSALLLVVGGAWLLINRLRDTKDQVQTGRATAFDSFFLALVLTVIASGCLVEAARLWFEPTLAVGLYIVHLGSVFSLFITFPYSKFAHLMYRTLALVHERMAIGLQPVTSTETTLSNKEQTHEQTGQPAR